MHERQTALNFEPACTAERADGRTAREGKEHTRVPAHPVPDRQRAASDDSTFSDATRSLIGAGYHRAPFLLFPALFLLLLLHGANGERLEILQVFSVHCLDKEKFSFEFFSAE